MHGQQYVKIWIKLQPVSFGFPRQITDSCFVRNYPNS